MKESSAELQKTSDALLADSGERQRAEEALRASEQRLQDILDNTTAVVFVKDLELRYILVNREYERRHQVQRDQIRGKTDFDIHPHDVAETLRANDRHVIDADSSIQFEITVPMPGDVRHYVVVKFLLRDRTGKPYAVCGIATDITERKRAESEIRQLNALLEKRVDERTNALLQSNDQLKRAEEKLRKHGEQVQKHRDVLLELARSDKSDLAKALRQICSVSTANVDLVIVAVSDGLHVPLAMDAVRAGKHVLVEKPLGITTQECEKLRLLVSPDQVFAVGCNRRFLPGVRAAKAFASRSHSVASYNAFYYDSTFRHSLTQPNLFPVEMRNSGRITKGAGADWKATDRRIYNLLTHSPHLLDLAGHLVGPIEKVRAIHRERDITPSAAESRSVSHVWHIDVGFIPRPGETEGATGHFELVLPRHGEFAEGFKLETNLGHALVEFPYVWFQREQRVEIYEAHTRSTFRPEGQDTNTFRLQLEARGHDSTRARL